MPSGRVLSLKIDLFPDLFVGAEIQMLTYYPYAPL
jgi:hypothetical protein